MNPVTIATDLVEDNSATVLALVTGLFAVTLGPKLVVIGVQRAGNALQRFAKSAGK